MDYTVIEVGGVTNPAAPSVVNLRRRAGGFSAVEVLIALTTAVTIAAIALPQIRRTLEVYRLNSSASIIASKLMDARLNAIKRNRDVDVTIDLAQRTMSMVTTDDDGEDIALGWEGALPAGITFDSGSASSLTFDSVGRVTAVQTIILKSSRSGEIKSVTVSPAGKITVT